jgi:hypothetical protein
MKTLAYIAILVLSVVGLVSAQALRIDSVSVDSVWNSDSVWSVGGTQHKQLRRDCKVSFIPNGNGGAVQIFLTMSVDSGKTWTFSPESLIVLYGGLTSLASIGIKKLLMIRVIGGDRSGVAFKVSGKQSQPKLSGKAIGLVAVVSPGQNAITTVTLNNSDLTANDGYSYLAKSFLDVNGDGKMDDSAEGAYTFTCNITVPAAGASAPKVIVKAKDLNGFWSAPETLTVTFGLLIDAAYRTIGNQQAIKSWFYSLWMIGDIASDDAEKGGYNPADMKELQDINDFSVKSKNIVTATHWYAPFEGIFLPNRIIDSLPKNSMDAALKTQYIGEAKFLRAWSFFILVKTFGDVPLLTHTLSFADYCQARAPKAQVWTQIETDLKEAASALPEKSEYAPADVWRASKGTANALLVKAYMYQSKFAEAKALADKIIASGQYSLEPNYADIFTLAHENGVESIFEFQYYDDTTNNSWGNDNPGQLITVFQGPRNYNNDGYSSGWGFDCPTQNLVDEFEIGDPRKKATIISAGDTLNNGTPGQWIPLNPYGYRPTPYNAKKYLLEYEKRRPAMRNSPANWRAIRYSEILLFAAEASNEVDETADALKYLNMVRARVGLPAVTTTDKAELRNAIYHERRVELAMEGDRFWDVVRQGRGAEVFGPRGFKKGINEVFPVPQAEIDSCALLTQNVGY